LSGRDVKRARNLHREPECDRQAPVCRRAGRGKQPVGDVFLDHRHDALGRMVELREPDQQRRRDVVGQIARDAPRAALGVGRIVECQRVGVLDRGRGEIGARTQQLDERRRDRRP
jgi:hypothetical protein